MLTFEIVDARTHRRTQARLPYKPCELIICSIFTFVQSIFFTDSFFGSEHRFICILTLKRMYICTLTCFFLLSDVTAGESIDSEGKNRFHCLNPLHHLMKFYPKWYYDFDAHGAKWVSINFLSLHVCRCVYLHASLCVNIRQLE